MRLTRDTLILPYFQFCRPLNGYTLCSGIICEELNGSDYAAVPLKETEVMTIGYVKRKSIQLSELAQLYVNELAKYKNLVLK